MCGRFALSAKTDEIEKLMPELKINAEIVGSYNIAPSQNIYAIIKTRQTELTEFRWGLIPSWAKDSSIGNRIINARAETITQKPAFKNLIKRKRCLVPATGYYEWRKTSTGGNKQPYFIKLKDEHIITFAALWDEWKSPQGNIIRSATLITCPASEEIAFIHDRMPVIIEDNLREIWLDPKTPLETVINILKPIDNNKLHYYTVTKAVNNPSFNNEKCIEPEAGLIF